MKISIVGTGYVGLVTGVCLSEINHQVVCIDTDVEKVKKMQAGFSPIYEPGLDDLMKKNIDRGTLRFTNSHEEGFRDAEVIFIAVGTPQLPDGKANLEYVESVAKTIGEQIQQNVIVVTKSTVPVGTNDFVKRTILQHLKSDVSVKVASNPEFLREGSAIVDTFQGDRIVIGTEENETATVLEELFRPLGIPIFKTDIYSPEMIKYASNAFLATKISFINEISNICEKVGANVEDVANGMGLDERIGRSFLNAGIGYGGSCFPKDTQALVQIAGGLKHDFQLLKSVIDVNNQQQLLLLEKLKKRFTNLQGLNVAMLGLSFKPNTDDMRGAASIVLAEQLVKEGAVVKVYDPIAMGNAKKLLPNELIYQNSTRECIQDADVTVIVTEWEEFKNMDLELFKQFVRSPILFDGRNCFDLETVKSKGIEYHSVGRPIINSSYPIIEETILVK